MALLSLISTWLKQLVARFAPWTTANSLSPGNANKPEPPMRTPDQDVKASWAYRFTHSLYSRPLEFRDGLWDESREDRKRRMARRKWENEIAGWIRTEIALGKPPSRAEINATYNAVSAAKGILAGHETTDWVIEVVGRPGIKIPGRTGISWDDIL